MAITKVIWAAAADMGVEIQNINDIQTLKCKSLDSLLTVIAIHDDTDIAVGTELGRNMGLIGDIIGIDRTADTGRRARLLPAGFDSVFNLEMIESPDFKGILQRSLGKARIRQTNSIMQEEYRRFRAALTASPDAFIVLDSDRRIFFVSEHYKRAYPALAQKLVRGLPVMEAFEIARIEQGVTDDDPRYPAMKAFWETLHGEVDFPMENGRTWRIKAAPLADSQGIIITTMDMTEILRQKREIEGKSRQVAEALEKEREASTLQKQFIGMVSHEFRTPLAIIDGNAQMIQRLNAGQEAQTRCKTIRSAVSRLVHMMESVLSSSMLKTGRLDVEPEEFDLGALVQELCEEQADLSRPGAITWDVSALTGNVVLDRKMMTLILTNLLSNAIKFTPENPQIRVSAGHEPGGGIVIEVADNGVGIPPAEIEHIFERYYRAPTSRGIPGTGIGLNLVRDLMELQGGSVRVESAVGQGTRLTLNLQNIKSNSLI